MGGPFTDVALEAGGRRVTAKTLTTSGAPDANSTESTDVRVRRATPNWLSAVGLGRAKTRWSTPRDLDDVAVRGNFRRLVGFCPEAPLIRPDACRRQLRPHRRY